MTERGNSSVVQSAGKDREPAIDVAHAPLRVPPRGDIREPEHADYLAAIWIIASNDEGSMITYTGLSFRLGIAESYARQLVASRPELFRQRLPPRRLDAWKRQLADGKHWPSWLLALPENERQAAVDKLAPDDCFRSQFRAEEGAGRSGLDIIEWGLKHLDRVRSTLVKYDEGIAKSWQMWIAMGLTVANIIIHLAIAAAKEGH